MFTGQTLGGGFQTPMPITIHPFVKGGTLANLSSQISVVKTERSFFEASAFFESFSRNVSSVPASMLSDLKRKAFSESGRMERIARSLAAVNAVQPTLLTTLEWRGIVEADVEDQY
jgi:hypothetical protein